MKIMLKKGPGELFDEIIRKEPVRLESIVREYQDELPYRILIGRVNGRDEELDFLIDKDSTVELLDMRTHSANLVYQHTLSLIYLKAVKDVLGIYGVEIENSLNKGLYTEIKTSDPVTEEQVRQIEARMRQLVDEDVPIVRESYSRQDAVDIWEKYNYPEKSRLLERADYVDEAKFYHIEGYRNFFYGLMAPSAGYIEYFELKKYRRGVLLRFPYYSKPDEIPPFVDEAKLYTAFGEAKKWQRLLGVSYLEDLNRKIRGGGAKDLILLSEALHEKKIAEIADMITRGKKRIVLIAGPSSSGKTTFAHRLSIALRVQGLRPVKVSLDDYYRNRNELPREADGSIDLERIDTLDTALISDHLKRLMDGETVELPEYDFNTGMRRNETHPFRVEAGQPIIIEGIHGLNEQLTEGIDRRLKFKIYISALTMLNLDDHNRIRTTDARLLRRIVRDYQFRGTPPEATMAMWNSVRHGEENYIFPYQEEADAMFNSSLTYELSIMKKYAYPALLAVKPDSPHYTLARRLVKFLNYIQTADVEDEIPVNSLLREFIGGCCFYRETD